MMRHVLVVKTPALAALTAMIGVVVCTGPGADVEPLVHQVADQTRLLGPAPTFEWKSSFEDGFVAWDQGHVYVREVGLIGRLSQQGARIETISDPTGSNRGRVMKAWIDGPPPAVVPEDDPIHSKRRGYPWIVFPLKPLPCSLQEDIWLSRDFLEQAMRPGNWYSPLSFTDSSPFESKAWHQAVTTGLRSDSRFGLNIKVGAEGAGERETYPQPLPGAPKVVAETWITHKVVVEADGKVSLFQDGAVIGAGQLSPTTRRGLVSGHGGLYVGHDISVPEGGFTSGYIYTDNFKIACW